MSHSNSIFQNTWDRRLHIVRREIESLGWTARSIEDTFDPKVLAEGVRLAKEGRGTRSVGDRQVDGVDSVQWEWLKFTPAVSLIRAALTRRDRFGRFSARSAARPSSAEVRIGGPSADRGQEVPRDQSR